MQYKATKPLTEIKSEVIDRINAAASDKILAKYPLWKQNNLLARAAELQSLGQTTGQEWADLQAAWTWIKQIRDASNIANGAIDTTTVISIIYQVETVFLDAISKL